LLASVAQREEWIESVLLLSFDKNKTVPSLREEVFVNFSSVGILIFITYWDPSCT
jgi:hypothetical protein